MKRLFIYFPDGPNEGAGGGAPAKVLIGEVSAQQIADWKKTYPLGIYAIKVGGHIAYFKMPDFDELNAGYSKIDQEKVTDMWLAFAELTMIGGSNTILKTPPLFAGAMKMIQKKVDGIKSELVEL